MVASFVKAENNYKNMEKLYQKYYDSILIESNSYNRLVFSFKLLELGTAAKNDSLISNALLEISHSYERIGNYSSALDYIFKCYSFAMKAEFKDFGSIFNVIGTIYYNLGNYDISIEYLRKALSIHLKNNNSLLAGDDYTNIGETYRLQGKYDSAFINFNKAYLFYNKVNSKGRIALAQCNLGLIYIYKNIDSKADSLFRLSFNYLRSINDYYPECITHYEIAQKAYLDKNIEKASQYALSAKNMASKCGFRKELIDILLLSSKISHEKGDFQEAFQHLTQYQAFKDSLINDKTVSQMAEMRAEFEISQNETEMSYLKKISKVRTNLLLVALVGMLAIAALAFYLLRLSRMLKLNNLRLSEFNEELNQKNHVIDLALQEKEMLMKEIHHRVKNNLQIISSIISLQSMRLDNPAMTDIFNEMQRRILTIAAIHQKLYQGNSVSLVNMKDYIEEVVESTHSSLNNSDLKVGYEIAVQNIDIDMDTAVSLGLIVNELTTNAYKYAFTPNRTNSLTITLIKTPQNNIELTLHDNGPGMPEGFTIENTNSLGLRMVSLLIRQRKGIIKYSYDAGTRIDIGFA